MKITINNEIINKENLMGFEIEECKTWHPAMAREFCICHEYFTRGTCNEYEEFLDFISKCEPNISNIFTAAKVIFDHSDWSDDELDHDDEVIESIMFHLTKEVIITSYRIR